MSGAITRRFVDVVRYAACVVKSLLNKILYVVVFQFSSFGLPYWLARLERFD
jgi:hypothetical protein